MFLSKRIVQYSNVNSVVSFPLNECMFFVSLQYVNMLISAFYRNLKRCYERWNYWETCEIKDAKRCIMTLFETMFWKLEQRKNFWKKHAKWCFLSVFEKLGTAEKMLKTRSLNDAFCRNLKRCFGSWNCWEKNKKTTGRLMVHSAAVWNDEKYGTDLSLSNVRAPISFSRDVFVSYTMLHWN